MFDIVIIAVGKIKEKFYRDGFNEYIKRLSPYARIKIEELKSEPFKNETEKNKSKEAEGERILNCLANYQDVTVFVLDEHGQELTSIDLASTLSRNQNSKLVFVLGGTVGLSNKILRNSKITKLSLSQMTLPHELARVVLAEQLYRGICISRGKDYHY